MENGKAWRIKNSTRGKLKVEERLVIQWSNKPLLNQSHPRKRIQLSKTQPLVSSSQLQHKHIKLSQNLQILKPLILYLCHQPLLPDHPLLNTNQNTRASTTTAGLLVLKNNISTHKAHDVLAAIAEQGHDVSVPSQAGVWKRVISEGQKMKFKIFQKLQNKDPYCLHFDGKRLKGEEYQVVLLKNMTTEIKLGIVKCESGSAKAFHKELHQIIDEYNA